MLNRGGEFEDRRYSASLPKTRKYSLDTARHCRRSADQTVHFRKGRRSERYVHAGECSGWKGSGGTHHPTQDDILYPLSGKAAMRVDGTGEFTLEPGIVVRVPKGTKHSITNVIEELLVLDVFCPALL